MPQIAGTFVPAGMAAGMRRRLLAAMEQEDAALQADKELEKELVSLYKAAPMPPALRRRLEEGTVWHRAYRRHLWFGAAAAAVAAVLVLPLLWPEPAAGIRVVEMKRELLPSAGSAPAMRRDTFVMQSEDKSCLVIKVQTPIELPLPDEVI